MLKHSARGKCTEDRGAKTKRSKQTKSKLNPSRNSRRVSRIQGGISSRIFWLSDYERRRDYRGKGGLSVHALVGQLCSGTTHLQKLNKTCRGQTTPEAERPLNKQRHKEERIVDRDKTVRQGHEDERLRHRLRCEAEEK